VLSFNDWSDISFIGDLNFLDSIDYLANQFLMPIGGMMVAIFAGWFLKPNLALDEFSDMIL
jgi:NSS family neurotransmitter:Na+ symporter